jgi:hypothetical protein
MLRNPKGRIAKKISHSLATAAIEQRNRRFQHDSEWLTVQIARLRAFGELDDREKLQTALRELEEHWRQMSKWMQDENKSKESIDMSPSR